MTSFCKEKEDKEGCAAFAFLTAGSALELLFHVAKLAQGLWRGCSKGDKNCWKIALWFGGGKTLKDEEVAEDPDKESCKLAMQEAIERGLWTIMIMPFHTQWVLSELI